MNYSSSNKLNTLSAHYLGANPDFAPDLSAPLKIFTGNEQEIDDIFIASCLDLKMRRHIVIGEYISQTECFEPLLPIFENKLQKILQKSKSEQHFLRDLQYELNVCCPRGDQLAFGYCIIDPQHNTLSLFSAGMTLISPNLESTNHLFRSEHNTLSELDKNPDYCFVTLDLEPNKPLIWCDKLVKNQLSLNEKGFNGDVEALTTLVKDIPRYLICAVELQAFLEYNITTNNQLIFGKQPPFILNLELTADLIKKWDPIPLILEKITQYALIKSHHCRLFTVLSELYSNALDHGLLKLDSSEKQGTDCLEQYYVERNKRLEALNHATIKIQLQINSYQKSAELTFTIEDSGDGFNIDAIEPKNIYSGRGLGLIKSLCNELEYSNNGKKATVKMLFYILDA